jgi:hypothetical protein
VSVVCVRAAVWRGFARRLAVFLGYRVGSVDWFGFCGADRFVFIADWAVCVCRASRGVVVHAEHFRGERGTREGIAFGVVVCVGKCQRIELAAYLRCMGHASTLASTGVGERVRPLVGSRAGFMRCSGFLAPPSGMAFCAVDGLLSKMRMGMCFSY